MSTTGLPSSLRTGETRVVTVRMRNTGGTTWTASKGYQLGSQSPVNNTTWGLNRKAVSGSVAPNGVHSFKLTIKAPSKPGSYSFRWRMRRNGTWFGDASASRTITVTSPPADKAMFVSYSGLPSSMTTGSTKTVTVTMRNTGGTTWTAGAGYQLGSQSPANNTTWGVNRKAVSGSVAPNGVHSFRFTIKGAVDGGELHLPLADAAKRDVVRRREYEPDDHGDLSARGQGEIRVVLRPAVVDDDGFDEDGDGDDEEHGHNDVDGGRGLQAGVPYVRGDAAVGSPRGRLVRQRRAEREPCVHVHDDGADDGGQLRLVSVGGCGGARSGSEARVRAARSQ